MQVVGVVGDVRNDGLGNPSVPEVYLSSGLLPVNPMRFVVRSSLPTATVVPAVRRAIGDLDPAQAVHDVAEVNAIVRDSTSLERIGSFMMTFFALAALLMATLGIYGVVSYSVRQATVELGTRMALGAVGRDLLYLVIGSGLKMAAYGAAIGAVAVVLSSVLLVKVFRIDDLGALPFVVSTAIVALISTGASFFPAWRATRLSPMVAIRNEPGTMWRATRETLRQTLSGLKSAVSFPDEPRLPEGDLLADFVAASRNASSFAEAFTGSLTILLNHLDATWLTLLERTDAGYHALATVPEGEKNLSIAADGFLPGRLRFYSYALPFSNSDLDGWLRWATGHHPALEAEIQSLKAAGARLAVPLPAKNDLVGLLVVGPKGIPKSAPRRATPLTVTPRDCCCGDVPNN